MHPDQIPGFPLGIFCFQLSGKRFPSIAPEMTRIVLIQAASPEEWNGRCTLIKSLAFRWGFFVFSHQQSFSVDRGRSKLRFFLIRSPLPEEWNGRCTLIKSLAFRWGFFVARTRYPIVCERNGLRLQLNRPKAFNPRSLLHVTIKGVWN